MINFSDLISRKIVKSSLFFLMLIFSLSACQRPSSEPVSVETKNQEAFPFNLPDEKPDRPLSAAMERLYTNYSAPRPDDNELFSQFPV